MERLMQVDWVAILPLLFLTSGGFLTFCVGAFWRSRPSWILFGIALVAAVGSAISAVCVAPGVRDFAGMVDVGNYSAFFIFVISGITVLSLLYSYQYAKARGFSIDEFYGVMLFAALGMELAAGAVHWLTFFLGLELLSISLYILVAVRKGEERSNEAGIKYFVMGAVASAVLVFGIAMIYAATGKMNIPQSLGVSTEAVSMTGMALGFGFITVGIGFKISMVPFHLWTPDVYQGAPAPVTAFMSTGSKVALMAALLRFSVSASESFWGHFLPVLWIAAALTMITGNVTAVVQTQLKRLLAYSSMAQVGYMLMALLAAKGRGASAIMFYTAAYALMDLGAFGTIALLSSEKEDLDSLEDYRGLGFSHPWKSALLTVCLFSLAGLPPTVGFVGKYVLFQATLQAGFVALAIVGIITAIVSVYYYLKVVVVLYMSSEESKAVVPDSGFFGDFANAAVLLFIFCLGIVPSYLLDLIAHIASGFST
jgi:NADH-quinone oxidoreductase subunit N